MITHAHLHIYTHRLSLTVISMHSASKKTKMISSAQDEQNEEHGLPKVFNDIETNFQN